MIQTHLRHRHALVEDVVVPADQVALDLDIEISALGGNDLKILTEGEEALLLGRSEREYYSSFQPQSSSEWYYAPQEVADAFCKANFKARAPLEGYHS